MGNICLDIYGDFRCFLGLIVFLVIIVIITFVSRLVILTLGLEECGCIMPCRCVLSLCGCIGLGNLGMIYRMNMKNYDLLSHF